MTHEDERPPAADVDPASAAVERLVRAAGSRPIGDAERMHRVRAAVHDAWRDVNRQRARRRRRALGALLVAAAAAVVIVVALARRTESPLRVLPPPAPAARLTAATGVITQGESRAPVNVGDEAAVGSAFDTGGALATFSLLDGGEVRANEQTRIRFIGVREIQVERGAIYLDGGPRHRSLVVQTPFGAVRDVGTRFEVAAVDGAWRVRVREGLVRFERGDVRRQAGAGQELMIESSGRIVERPAATYGAGWTWVVHAAPAFQIEGRTLPEFLDWVVRESGRRIEFSSDELRGRTSGTILHGSIDNLTAEEALGVVLPTCGFSHRIESQRVLVTSLETRGDGRR
jgi:ferric-dicitrate binding protein FerR (iron transport regulator)